MAPQPKVTKPATKPERPRSNQQHICRPKLLTCFNIFFALSLLEAISLIAVSFGSEQMKLLGDASWFVEMAEELFLWDSLNGNGASPKNDDDIVELEDGLVGRKEKEVANELDDDNLIQAEANQEAANAANNTAATRPVLDNYSKRPHIPNKMPIPLIVGGSDGSGTRAFVDVLGRLGVPMLVDDRGTMDIHAAEMFRGGGWPPLVQMVIGALHTANYTYENLPSNLTSTLMAQVATLDSKLQLRAERLRSVAQTKKSEHLLASGVKFGFKAPVSMLVIPLLLKHYGRIRFLHVVRDGRDVALSANQSPVQKFYRYFYANPENQIKGFKNYTEKDPKFYTATSQKNLMAMQLWNDWNTQVHDWERQFADGKNFDYLVMRTEDLLDPDTKFHALQQLADFVGSPKTKQEICCMSRKAVVDMGASGGVSSLGNRNRFSHVVRNRVTTMSRDERIEALRQYRASRAVTGSAAAKHGNFPQKQSVPLRTANSFTTPHTRVGAAGLPINRQIRPHRRADADGVGIPILEHDQSAPIEKSEAAVRKDLQAAAIKAVPHPLDLNRKEMYDDLAKRIADRVKEKISEKATATEKEQRRRRLLDLFGSSTKSSVEDFRKEFFNWKSQFARVRLDPAKFADEVLVNGEKILKKYAEPSLEKTGGAEDIKIRADLKRQMQAPMAHLTRLVEQVHSGRFKSVHERYGKWAKALQNRPELSKLMHSYGSTGLSRFGYEPQADFMDFRETGFVCDASVVCAA